jgi:glycyl-tRNA synthetase
VLALADKIDNLLGYFSVGLKPTSSSDPFALKRQSMGIIRLLINEKISCNLPALFEACAAHFTRPVSRDVITEVFAYLTARARSVMEEMGFKKDTISASLTPRLTDPYDQLCKMQALSTFRGQGEAFSKLVEVYKRAKGILEKPLTIPFDASLATESAEKEVVTALEKLEAQWTDVLATHDYERAFRLMATLQAPLAKLFDEVRILCDDPKVQDNRIVLLQKIFAHFQTLLDFSQIQL